MADLKYYKLRYPEQWATLSYRPDLFVRELYNAGVLPYEDAVTIADELIDLDMPAEAKAAAIDISPPEGEPTPVITEADRAAAIGVPAFQPDQAYRREVGSALFDRMKEYFRVAFREVLISLWEWTREQIYNLIDLIVNSLRPALAEAWELVKGKFEEYGRELYDGAMKLFDSNGPITPETAPALALRLYLFAMGMGVAAHGTATVTELLHPLKRVGLHQTAAVMGDFAGFGRISAATMGTLVNRVLGQSMTYACQNRYRPRIPHENLLIEFRAKREIDKAQFDKAMGYQGFSQEWTDVIERWQWKDPRMFEIIRLADVGLEQGPAPAEELPWLKRFGVTGEKLKDWWLYRKFMRAGYEDVDLPVMVRFIHRREVAFALTYVRTAIRRNYRWGYLTDKELEQWMERLNLPEQAKEWIFWAGELDREYFYRQDLQRYYVTAYKNDQIDEDELMISLLAMGLPSRETEIIVRTEKVKRKPKPTIKVAPAVKKPLSEIQKKYITLYRDQFRKNMITSDQYLAALLAVGLEPDLADVSVALEETRKAPGLPA